MSAAFHNFQSLESCSPVISNHWNFACARGAAEIRSFGIAGGAAS